MDAANGAATATISNGGTQVAPTGRTAVDTLVGRNITDHTTPDATALRECHFGEQQHPRQIKECAGRTWRDYSGAPREKEGPDGLPETQANPHLNARAALLVSLIRARLSSIVHHRVCQGGGKPHHSTPTRSVGFCVDNPTRQHEKNPAGAGLSRYRMDLPAMLGHSQSDHSEKDLALASPLHQRHGWRLVAQRAEDFHSRKTKRESRFAD